MREITAAILIQYAKENNLSFEYRTAIASRFEEYTGIGDMIDIPRTWIAINTEPGIYFWWEECVNFENPGEGYVFFSERYNANVGRSIKTTSCARKIESKILNSIQ